MNKRIAAQKIRQQLERRIATILDCKLEELPHLKLGTCVHLLFALKGDSQELGGFETTMSGVLQLVGHELTWDIETKTEEEQAVIN
jgi:hypothetical protein